MIPMQTVLCADSLNVGYPAKQVLTDLTFTIEKGSFVSLLGPNGAGKTTLLRTLSRHLAPLSGAVFIENTDLSSLTQKGLAKRMSVVLTEKVNPPFFTVRDFVALGRYPHTGFLGTLSTEDKEKVERALSQVHAGDLEDRDINTLSDGERQKVLIARALAQEPRIILLDEPTMHLDLKHRMEVMTILRELCRDQGITVLASLHDVDIAAKISDKVALVKDGTITAWGDPETVLNSSAVSDLYDFSGVSFNRYLGSIEVKGNPTGRSVFVVGGMGSAATVYRLLSKRGFAVSTGVLHKNDLDYYVAESLGIPCFSEAPMAVLNGQTAEQAKACMEKAECVIDTGFYLGPLNMGNQTLIQTALAMDKPVFSLRSNGRENDFYSESTGRLMFSNDETGLLDRMEAHFKG